MKGYIVRSVAQSCLTPCNHMKCTRQAPLSITNSWSSLKFMSIESVMPSNHLILCHPLLLLPSFFPSIRVFSNKSALSIRWPKYWSFSFSISPSNEYSGLISFMIDWFDLLAVQGTLKSLLRHLSSKAKILLGVIHPFEEIHCFPSSIPGTSIPEPGGKLQKKNSYPPITHYTPGSSQTPAYAIRLPVLQTGHCDCPHFAGEDTEAQRR